MSDTTTRIRYPYVEHWPKPCPCATTPTQIDPDCRCAEHGPCMTLVCLGCKKQYGLRACEPEQSGKVSHGYCKPCEAKLELTGGGGEV
jgi:hypothetical protein